MKRIAILCLALLILLSAGASAEEIILNKIRGDHADFTFAEDAKLLEVYFPQVFGCDAALVRYGDYSMLIDCAGNQWKTVKQTLDKLGVTQLTYAVNSHPDADHIGGFNRVLKDIPAGEFLLGFPEDHDSGDEVRFQVYEDLHAQGIPFRRVHHGDTIDFGDVKITVYQRTDDHLPRVNNKSVMLMIQYGERRIFFTGDVQAAAQELIGANSEGLDLDCAILKFPHHGYDRMQKEFLDLTAPELVICTCGDSKTEGIKQLKERKIPYQMTANQTLLLKTDGKVWTMERIPMKIK